MVVVAGVLITGGSGAFGRAYAAHLLAHTATERIVIFSRGEHKHEAMEKEIPDPDGRLRYFLGDVRDLRRLQLAMRGVDTVVHAAALKIVPKLEYNPTEAVRTNVDGAVNVVEAALHSGCVERVIGLSTDKACAPVNLYGSTKLTAEKTFLAANDYGGRSVRFSVVRYGNVSGSTGSVIPRWREQLERGDPVTVTDARMTRFWMTLADAVELVVECCYTGEPAEVMIPKLPTYRVMDLAYAVAGVGATVTFTGIRAGEKLHESLISPDEAPWAWEDRPTATYRIRPFAAPNQTDAQWSYNSDTGEVRLTVKELQQRLEEL